MGTIKIHEIDAIFYDLLGQESTELLIEDLTTSDKSEIKTMVKKEIKDFLKITRDSELENRVFNIVKDKIKKDKDIEKNFVEICRNVLTQLYKALWMRRSFWRNELKNVAS